MGIEGSWMSLSRNDETIDDIEGLGNNPGVVGIQMRRPWKDIETGFGVYDFTEVHAYLNECKLYGLKMMLLIEDRTFISNLDPIPPYLDVQGDDPPYSHKTDGSSSFPDAYVGLRWKDYYMERYEALLDAIGAEFDMDPAFAGVCCNESSYGLKDGTANSEGYTVAKYKTALIRRMQDGKDALPNSEVIAYNNFMPQDLNGPTLGEIADAAGPNDIDCYNGGPDVLPGDNGLMTNQWRLYPVMEARLGNKHFLCHQNDSYNWEGNNGEDPPYDNGNGYWTPEALLLWCIATKGTSVVIFNQWTNNGYNWPDALPAIEYYSTFPKYIDASNVYTDVQSFQYFDLTAGVNGDGSGQSPYNTMASATYQDNTIYSFLRGKTHVFPPGLGGVNVDTGAEANNIRITSYGDTLEVGKPWQGNPAVLDGQADLGAFTVDTGEVYRCTGTTIDNDHGVVFEDGVPLFYMQEVNTNVAQTIAAMPRGYFYYDRVGQDLYVRATDGADPDTHDMTVARCQRNIRFNSAFPTNFVMVDDLRSQGCSRANFKFNNCNDLEVHNIHMRWSGVGGTEPVGSGIEISNDCDGFLVRDNLIEYVFDSPVSPQISLDVTLTNGVIENNDLVGGALGGVEIANFSSGGTVSNIIVRNNHIRLQGDGWPQQGDVLGNNLTNGVQIWRSNGGFTENIDIVDNLIENCDNAGVHVADGRHINVNINRNIIRNCDKGFRSFNDDVTDRSVNFEFNEVESCSTGVEFNNKNATTKDRVRKNTLADCFNGIDILNMDTIEHTIADNNMTGNGGGIGITMTGSDLPGDGVENNNVWNYGTPYSGFTPKASNLNVDPMFFPTPDSDYVLDSNSPLVRAGSRYPGWETETDRLGNLYYQDDIGAYATAESLVNPGRGVLLHKPRALRIEFSGEPVPNAQAAFALSGTTDPAPIYTDDGLRYEAQNPIKADAEGRFPLIYLDSSIDYRCVIADADDVIFDDVDPIELAENADDITVLDAAGNYVGSTIGAVLQEIGLDWIKVDEPQTITGDVYVAGGSIAADIARPRITDFSLKVFHPTIEDGRVSLDFSLGPVQVLELDQNVIATFENWPEDATSQMVVIVLQDDNGGAYTVDWLPNVRWSGGPPTVSTADGAIDVYTVTSFAGVLLGDYSQDFS